MNMTRECKSIKRLDIWRSLKDVFLLRGGFNILHKINRETEETVLPEVLSLPGLGTISIKSLSRAPINMSFLLKSALIFLVLSNLLNVIAVATIGWGKVTGKIERWQGLWEYCDYTGIKNTKSDCFYNGNRPWSEVQAGYFWATQWTVALGSAAMVISLLILILRMFVEAFKNKMSKALWISLCFAGDLLLVVGVVSFGVNFPDYYFQELHYSYGLCCIAMTMGVFAGIFGLVDNFDVTR
ncbi:uncharacterized protein LOC106167956 [Lingula anatina]|uniref:Uncharacterized protein LOC106167956 n=1 Tax=Lingula anatina TaxID=7574 RepID=A0A1S3IVV3_LINAN|nr:uncharacterized protein LOC106167956 [Lingula anatina]|eukprot:XP_013402322.1 uncharacterized protein LOC106167956 [Lingula anatina]